LTPASADAAVETLARLERRLLDLRAPEGHWVGELSSSALATATAVGALALARRAGLDVPERLVAAGRRWLARSRNPDGGWGDTPVSASNISTTALAWGALALAGATDVDERRAETEAAVWLCRAAGGLDASRLARALAERYGSDRTFSAPILTFLAVSGRLGPEAWRQVAALPFELALVPQRWLGALRLPVVSYALPALIAIGQLRHHYRPTRNPLARLVRHWAREPTLRTLDRLQPEGGGYLEAVPLTSFVLVSLIAAGHAAHPVVARGLRFLAESARADGSWPIDTDLACWVTTLAVGALGARGFSEGERRGLARWLLGCQRRAVHAYTQAAPGGWAWTDRSGGVPDADDTAGALLALAELAGDDTEARQAAALGVRWLIGLQNRDGGVPTFCRGWGALPFDRSSPDLTAHALRAWAAWRRRLPCEDRGRVERASARALAYLAGAQRADGSWVPLWFGNESAPGERSPTYGTARVVVGLAALAREWPEVARLVERGRDWLLAAQNTDGGWGGAPGVAASLEETGLAVSALSVLSGAPARDAARRGVAWLVERSQRGRVTPAAPIGLYFARLWYGEALYPLVFATEALRRMIAAP
jgi:squalene-hopene/tetraprenyl-beta-curcumene cyclase